RMLRAHVEGHVLGDDAAAVLRALDLDLEAHESHRRALYLQQALTRRRDAVVLLRLDEILAQRVPRAGLRHEQPAQIRVTGEAHAEQVEALALLPVGVGPDGGDG